MMTNPLSGQKKALRLFVPSLKVLALCCPILLRNLSDEEFDRAKLVDRSAKKYARRYWSMEGTGRVIGHRINL